jgi:hypothetical protein
MIFVQNRSRDESVKCLKRKLECRSYDEFEQEPRG